MGWIVAVFVVIALAWAVAICYEFARPGKLNWNQPSWLIPRRRSGTPPRGGAGPQPPRDGAEPPRDEDQGASR